MPAYLVETEHRETDQVFSYHYGDSMLHFNVSLLARLRAQMPSEFVRITMDLDDKVYGLCMEHRGIEEPKIAALIPKQLREPGYGVRLPDGSFAMVDGHHRLVRRYRGGVRVMDFYVTDEPIWRHCLVLYTPEGERIIAQAMPPKVADPPQFATPFTVKPERRK